MGNDLYKVVLLNSGGADALASAILLKKAGYRVTSLFLTYGQPSVEAELQSVRKFTSNLVVRPLHLESAFNPTGLDQASQEIYLRNYLFLTYAVHFAYTHKIANVAFGLTSILDNETYIDDDPSFLQQFHLLNKSYFDVRILTPVAGMNKEMVYSLLLDNGVDPDTLPYCNLSAEPCGQCSKCQLTKSTLTLLKEERKRAKVT